LPFFLAKEWTNPLDIPQYKIHLEWESLVMPAEACHFHIFSALPVGKFMPV